MRVAIVHDYLNQYGGAERVLEALRSQGASVMHLAVDSRLAGLLAVSDPIKATTPDSPAEVIDLEGGSPGEHDVVVRPYGGSTGPFLLRIEEIH